MVVHESRYAAPYNDCSPKEGERGKGKGTDGERCSLKWPDNVDTLIGSAECGSCRAPYGKITPRRPSFISRRRPRRNRRRCCRHRWPSTARSFLASRFTFHARADNDN